MTTYVEVARKLAMPTVEQTRKFAEYVTGAHSWYKHLAEDQSSPFVFFLDPNSGRAMVHVSDEEVAFVDNTDDSEKFHYTWQTTEDYRRRFGFWNYEAPYGRSIQYPSAEGVVDTAGAGLNILDAEAGWIEVPRILAETGTALVSSLMYAPSWGSNHPSDLKQRGYEVVNQFVFVSPPAKFDEDQNRYYEKLTQVLPTDIVDALRPLHALWEDDIFQQEKTEAYRAHDEYRKAEMDNRLRELPSTADPGFILFQQAEEKWEMTASRRKECLLLEPLIAGIDRERERQISGMVDAMNRFVASLHADGHA